VAPPIPTTHQPSILISPKKNLLVIIHNLSPQVLLNNKYIFCDGWINSEIYLSRFDSTSSRKHFPQIYRAEDEDSCPKDKLLDGGMRGKYKKGQATEKPDNITQTSISYSLYD
jgi:hypothetical protein